MEHPDTREKLLKKKDLVHIVKVSDDTFAALKLSRFSG